MTPHILTKLGERSSMKIHPNLGRNMSKIYLGYRKLGSLSLRFYKFQFKIQSNLSLRPPLNNDYLSTATTILGSHFQFF